MEEIKSNKDNDFLIPVSTEIGENCFNAIRFFCCLVVIGGHCFDISHTKFIYRNFIDMHISVCVFFILSGFWVTKSYLGTKDLKSYIVKRIKRLLPMYYLSVLLFAVICGFYSDLGVKGYFSSSGLYKYLFWNGIFLNFVCPSLPGVFSGVAINGALWTIKVEIGFYIILPVLIFIIKKLSNQKKRNVFLICIYILSVTWNEGLGYLSSRENIPSQLAYQLPGFMSYFVMGMLFLLNWNYLISKKNIYIVPAIIIFALHYVTKTEILMPMALTCILMWAGKTLLCFKRVGMPVDYSYGMYLYHFPLINILSNHLYFNQSFIWGWLAVFSLSFLMAFFTEKYIQSKIK